MQTCLRLCCLLGVLTAASACAARPPASARPAAPPDLQGIVATLRDLAAGSTGLAQALQSLGRVPPHDTLGSSGNPGDLRLPGFTSGDGYRIETVEIRVRAGGLEGAPLLLLHIGTTPCAQVDELAGWIGADRKLSVAPSPHLPQGIGARGYARDYGTRRIELLADRDGPDCVTVIGVHRPAA